EFTYITYPFRLPEDEEKKKVYIPLVKGAEFHGDALTVMKRTYAVIPLLTRTLLEMKGNYYRDNFLDVIGMMMDMDMAPLYERLSFGPGQRYASKGCYIVQLTQGPKPVLVKKSGWVIH
ncbi:MAG TPA: amino acid ABC transporter substrate-binding protein, partial [Nitrospirota bacterium]